MNQLFLNLVRGEVYKLFSRPLVRFALVLSVAIGLVVPWIGSGFLENATVGGRSGSELAPTDAAAWAIWALYVRNSYVMRLFVVLAGAAVLAGEFAERTLREDLLRPVSKLELVLAKWIGLSAFVAATLVLTAVAGAAAGALLGGGVGDVGALLTCLALTWAADTGFSALVLAISAVSSTVAGTVAGVLLFVIADTSAWAFLGLVSWAVGLAQTQGATVELPEWVDVAILCEPWLPSSAFNAWTQYEGALVWQNWAALVVVTLLSLTFAHRALERRDVP